jgi:hypothetical protein
MALSKLISGGMPNINPAMFQGQDFQNMLSSVMSNP